MWLPERNRKSVSYFLPIAVLSALALASACTVQPLYSNHPVAASAISDSTSAQLNSVAVKPVTTRYAQEIRNHLIFYFGGGKGEPENPAYELELGVTKLNEVSTFVQIADEDQPTARTLTLISSYRLTKAGAEVARVRRQVSSQYDVPTQEFANLRAEIDAENRAARELAELLRLAVAQDLKRTGPR